MAVIARDFGFSEQIRHHFGHRGTAQCAGGGGSNLLTCPQLCIFASRGVDTQHMLSGDDSGGTHGTWSPNHKGYVGKKDFKN